MKSRCARNEDCLRPSTTSAAGRRLSGKLRNGRPAHVTAVACDTIGRIASDERFPLNVNGWTVGGDVRLAVLAAFDAPGKEHNAEQAEYRNGRGGAW